jgi:alpha-D-ribose 1-methylphosphonate 5-triphosphate synthase subunit PhnG
MGTLRINAKRAAEQIQEGQVEISPIRAPMPGLASTQVSAGVNGGAVALGDVAMAEATAHVVSAYRALEDVALMSSPFAGTEHFLTAARSLFTALLAIDECCADTWTAPAGLPVS